MADFFTFNDASPSSVFQAQQQQPQTQPQSSFFSGSGSNLQQQQQDTQSFFNSATQQQPQQRRPLPLSFDHFALPSSQTFAALGSDARQTQEQTSSSFQPVPNYASSNPFDLRSATTPQQQLNGASAHQADVFQSHGFGTQPMVQGQHAFSQDAFKQDAFKQAAFASAFQQPDPLQPSQFTGAIQSGVQSVFGGFDGTSAAAFDNPQNIFGLQSTQPTQQQNPFLTPAQAAAAAAAEREQGASNNQNAFAQQPFFEGGQQAPLSTSSSRDPDQLKWLRAADACDVVYGCAWLTTTDTCVIADAKGLIQCVRVEDQGRSASVVGQKQASSAVSSLAALSPTHVCCANAEGTVTTWDLQANGAQQPLGTFGQLVAYEQHQRHLVVGSWSKQVVIIDMRQPSKHATIKLQGKCHAVDVRGLNVAVGVNTDPSNVHVLLYDARRTDAPALTLKLKQEEGMVRSVAVNDHLLAYGTQRGYVGAHSLVRTSSEPLSRFDMLEASRTRTLQQLQQQRPVSLMVNKVIFSGNDTYVDVHLLLVLLQARNLDSCTGHNFNFNAYALLLQTKNQVRCTLKRRTHES
jgi:hypothetical protein